MGKFKFCDFFGISVPTLILLDISPKDFKGCTELLNNSLEVSRLENYIKEGDIFFRQVFNNLLWEYQSPDLRRKANQLRSSLAYYENPSKTGKKPKLTLEECDAVKALLDSAPKQLAPYVMKNNVRVDLSPAACTILQYFEDRQYILEEQLQSIDLFKDSDDLFFNKKIEDLQAINPLSLHYKFMQRIQSVKGNTKKIDGLLRKTIEDLRKDTLEMKKYIVKPEDASNLTASSASNNILLVGESTLLNVPDIFDTNDMQFLLYLAKNNILANCTLDSLRLLCNLYKAVITVDEDLFNSEFGLTLTKEEYEKVFTELENIGLVGLSFHTKEFFFDALKTLTLTKHEPAKIVEGSALAVTLDELDRSTSNLLRVFGEAI